MKHAEKIDMLARIKRDIAHAEECRDGAHKTAEGIELPRIPKGGPDKMTKSELAALGTAQGQREWQRGVGTAWAGIRERLLSLQRFVVNLPIDDLDTIVGAGAGGQPNTKKAKPRAPGKRKGR